LSNFADSLADLESYLTARVPVIAVQSIEPPRALRLIREAANRPRRANQGYWIYTRATGLRDLRTNAFVHDDRSFTGAMEFAATQFSNRPQSTIVFVEPDDLANDSAVSRHMAELARLADTNSGSIVLVVDSPVWTGLQRLGMNVTLDLPDSGEMYDTVFGFLEDHHGVIDIQWSEQDARRASEFLVGVTEGTAINVMATVAAKGNITKADVEHLAKVKDRHFANLAGLERVSLKDGDLSVGGLTSLRAWLSRKHQLMVADLRGSELRPPRGVLLVGVPGCGKSLSAKAIASAWQLPLYRLDFATILGQYVGQSETRFREALDTADRVAPCVLWIDEIEKGLAGQHDSTGVSRRLIGQFLFWLQESSSRVFIVATSNDVRSLPPELLRKGRFDELFFVDLPDPDDRREIIEMYYGRYVKAAPPADLLPALVELSDGFAGSDIEAALHEVGAEVTLNGGVQSLTPSFVVDTFRNAVPLSQTNPDQIEEIRAWGRERALPAGRAHATSGPSMPAGRRVLRIDH
jgi:hypothetical protein